MGQQLESTLDLAESSLMRGHSTVSSYLGSKEMMQLPLPAKHEKSVKELGIYASDVVSSVESIRQLISKLHNVEKEFNSRLDILGLDDGQKYTELSCEALMEEMERVSPLSVKMRDELYELGEVYRKSINDIKAKTGERGGGEPQEQEIPFRMVREEPGADLEEEKHD